MAVYPSPCECHGPTPKGARRGRRHGPRVGWPPGDDASPRFHLADRGALSGMTAANSHWDTSSRRVAPSEREGCQMLDARPAAGRAEPSVDEILERDDVAA